MKHLDKQRRAHGFTMIELMVVIAIMMVVAAVAIPNISKAMEDIRLRATLRDVVGLLQQARQTAIKNNTYYKMGLGPNGDLIYVDLNKNNQYDAAAQNCPGANCQPAEPVVQLASRITLNNGAPAFNNAQVGANFNPCMNCGPPAFNARGLPCVMVAAGGPCSSYSGGLVPGPAGVNVGFLFFFQQQRTFGPPNWGAIAITPAGRMETWYWDANGNAWAQQ